MHGFVSCAQAACRNGRKPRPVTGLSKSAISVTLADECDESAWQAFVDSREDSGPLHHAGWLRVLRDASSVRTHFLVAKDASGTIRGVAPGYVSKSRLTGAHYTTLEGGILADGAEARDALDASVLSLRSERGLRFVQIRGGMQPGTGATTVNTVHTVVSTSAGEDAAWYAIKTKTRWAIRQDEKRGGLSVDEDPSLAHLDTFYSLYAEHMRELGTPVFGARLFHAMREHLSVQRLRLFLLRYNGSPVGGMLCIANGNRWTDQYAIVRRARAPEFANYVLYWNVIKRAAVAGILALDLGRSTPKSNVHLFKRKWGGVDVDVPYWFYPAHGVNAERMGLLDSDRTKGRAQILWSKLPLAVCNVAGPLLRRDLPFL